LGILAGKQTLADGVLDGRQELDAMPLPSGRAAFLERLEEILELRLAAGETAPAPEIPAPERLRQDLSALLGERLLMLDLLPRGEAEPKTVLAVVDRLDGAAAQAREDVEAAVHRTFGEGPQAPRLELLDRATWETLQRLAEAGVVQLAPELAAAAGGEPLHRSPALADRQEDLRRRRLAAARELVAEGGRKLRMSALLAANGFAAEAVAPLAEALEHGLLGLARLAGIDGESALDLGPQLEARFGSLAVDGVGFLGYLRAQRADGGAATPSQTNADEWLARGEALFRRIEESLDRAALGGGPAAGEAPSAS
jgi:hypothetical protein